MRQQSDLPGAASLASFCEAEESELIFTDELRHILEVIASTGKYWHEWSMLKCLVSFRLKQVLMEYNDSHIADGGRSTLLSGETFSSFEGRLVEGLEWFIDGPPFTLQRLCELLLNPRLTYPNIDKASLAFEKLLLVTSTLPMCKDPYPVFSSSKEEHVCNQMSELEPTKNDAGANGVPDEEMLDVAISENKQSNSKKLPAADDEISLSSKNKESLEDADSPLDGLVEEQLSKDQSSINEELVDIPLSDPKTDVDA